MWLGQTLWLRARLVGQVVLILLVTGTPWWFGGVTASAQVWLFWGVLVALGWCLVAQLADPAADDRVPSAIIPLVCALGLGAFQLLPLDDGILDRLSPRGTELRRFLMSEQNPSDTALARKLGFETTAQRQTLSLYPASTRNDLALLVLAAATFLLGSALFRNAQSQIWLLGALAVNGAALTFFGIVQAITFNGSLYWRVPLTHGGRPFGPFVNGNNAGGFLILCLAGALGMMVWAFRRSGFLHDSAAREDPPRRRAGSWFGRPWRALLEYLAHLDGWTVLALVLAGWITAGVLCSLSRGAAVAMLGAAAVTGAVVALARRGNVRLGWIGLAAVAGLALVAWGGMSVPVRTRLATLMNFGSASEARLPVWRDGLRVVGDFWLTGSGLGTFRFVHGLYQDRPNEVWFYHAENQYLEALVDGGVLGLGCLLAMIAFVGTAAWRLLRVNSRGRTLAMGIAGMFALSGTAIAAFLDFGLYIPANMLVFALLCGAMAGRTADLADERGGARLWVLSGSPLCPRILTVASLASVLWGALELSRVARLESGVKAAEATLTRAGATADTLLDTAQELAADLEQRADDAQAQCNLANVWIHRYRSVAFDQLLDQAPASVDRNRLWEATLPLVIHGRAHQFVQANARAPLQALRNEPVVRENLLPALKHLVLARRACPLLPQVHLLIGQLGVLVAEPGDDQIHLQRSQRSAPSQPIVLFQCGLLELQAERSDAALDTWRRCLTLSQAYLPQILRLAERQLRRPSALERLFPDSPLLLITLAREQYGTEERAQVREALVRRAADLIRDGSFPEDESHYLRGAVLALRGEYQPAISCYAQAVGLRPHETRWRYELALLLQHVGRIEEAHGHVQGCLLAEPGNKAYQTLLENLNRIRTRADVTDKQ